MLLDNKTITEEDFCKVFDFISEHTKKGNLDIVTGFFSVHALSKIYDKVNEPEKFRMILGNLLKEDIEEHKIVDLLNGDAGIDNTIQLKESAQKALEFLMQEKVAVKTIQKNFCHAKTYLYTDKVRTKNYFIVGSSNLTEAGLGIKDSSNIELNIAKHDYEDEFKHLKNWFREQWDKVAQDKIELPDKSKVEVKQYIKKLIENFYKEYSPHDLYYKILYELFKEDLLTLSGDAEFKREIAHLEETVIYRTLYPFQQKGAISLIKMLQTLSGAILADAVGLGKTWTALSVMKYFELKGYTVLLLCPKKLRHNWEQYKIGHHSRFERDEIEYYVRFHTDLQGDRLDGYPDKKLRFFQSRIKLLIVLDESHNLRNDKSSRYKFLVDKLLLPEKPNRDVKVLHLSATPINNKLLDIRNQFKLITRGLDDGFRETLDIESLENIFRNAQKDFSDWTEKPDRKIADFISKLPPKFEKLTDALIVARTRKLIENEFGEMNFPRKAEPVNEYITPENLGTLKSFDDIINALRINLTAYRPSEYITDLKIVSVLENPKQREKFLAKMMYILLVKRLESSWYSFSRTVENILDHHQNTLDKVQRFIETKADIELNTDLSPEQEEELDETAGETPDSGEEETFTLGKKNPVPLSKITNINLFTKHLEADIAKLIRLKENLDQFGSGFDAGHIRDEKFEKLLEHIHAKQKTGNKKVLVFTVFRDTAKFLFDELKKRNIGRLAYVSGTISETSDGYSGANFEEILERFAPYTKLYNEKDWSEFYQKAGLGFEFREGEKWKVPYGKWLELLAEHSKTTLRKIENPIDILIATDCLSEGQNLQDCDLVVNYDIHWNPVRLIQRMGRIDRLGSPNQTVRGINFWPGKNYEDYLRLKKRVEERMALMSLVGTELEDVTEDLKVMIEGNPLLPRQAEKMLRQLQITWDDVDANDETLALSDLSLEQFRQELFEFFKQNEEFFRQIPNGVYTGFRFKPNRKWSSMPLSLVSVLGYPRRPDDVKNHVYSEMHLLQQPLDGSSNQQTNLNNNQEILALLRFHKLEDRHVPPDIDNSDKKALQQLSDSIAQWLKNQVPQTAVSQIHSLFSGDAIPQKISPDKKKVEEKFRKENFDLINWFIIS